MKQTVEYDIDDGFLGCDKDGYVMSFSRGTKGEVLWSTCSAEVIDKLNMPCLEEKSAPPAPENDHAAKYKNVPGKEPYLPTGSDYI